MLSSLRFILKSQLKRQSNRGGFTLIELLVAIIMAALIITPVLGFMINFLQTDRREQAKTTTEQDIQAALDYIAQDMQQAIYIYDKDGLNGTGIQGISEELASLPCPADADECKPILVFWKRRFLSREVTGQINDHFVYSLVAYSIADNKNDANGTWSPTARILRYEFRDGLDIDPENRNGDEVQSNPAGFAPFSLAGTGSLANKMNRWGEDSGSANANWGTPGGSPPSATLIDYIDEPDSEAPLIECEQLRGEQRIPATDDDDPNVGFVACISTLPSDSSIPTGRVYIRGNALARVPTLKDAVKNEDDYKKYSTFFPKSSIQVQGNSFLFTQ
ncbi:hormogonium polysaccharide secretion pseudopilin HpsC [Coleofasciculus sp. F4-SAH-05]|uniref:hormogonium polysaccharide secretion pseudopilin HpsC n=1 Tax=Coleofasciculus sp. F4-SAH-05 TaxID=3069525 RepID=UPI0032F150AD